MSVDAGDSKLRIVDESSKYGRAKLIEPSDRGYIHLAAQTGTPRMPLKPNTDPEFLSGLKELVSHLDGCDGVRRATVFKAAAMPPVAQLPYVRDHADSIRLARFDSVVLVETESPESLEEVQATPLFEALEQYMTSGAMATHIMAARCAKRMGEVDPTAEGLFVCNYFVADEPAMLMSLWDHLAGWFQAEMGLDNGELLVPLDKGRSDYLAINVARFDGGVAGFLARQLSKRSFRTYLLANLEANHVGTMPILYQRA